MSVEKPLEIGSAYQNLVINLAGKLRLGAAIDQPVTLDPIASKQLADVLENMAKRLDAACAMFKELDKEGP